MLREISLTAGIKRQNDYRELGILVANSNLMNQCRSKL